MEFTKVIIVGGGAAGLGAAKTLGASTDYLLLEAADYLGGRIRTVDAVPNVVVDMGAQFIHGQTNNLVYEVCDRLNCILPDKKHADTDMLVITSERTTIDPKIMLQARTVWEELLDDAEAKFAEQATPTDYPFSNFLLEHFHKRLAASIPAETKLLDALIEYFQQAELIENGCLSLSQLSLAEYGSFEYLDGAYEYQFRNGGYRPFLSYLKSFLPDDNRVRLNSEVIGVKYLPEQRRLQVDVRSSQSTDKEEISSMQCEHLIWTSSLGYLKENFHSVFADESELIAQKQEAIANLGFDTVNKVVLVYDNRFWPENVCEIILLHTSDPLLADDLESFQNEGIEPHVLKTIIQSIHRYDVLPSTDVPVLVCWFGGSAALLLEDLSEASICRICHGVLCKSLNLSTDSHPPRRVLKSDWHKNRFTRGSYTYYSVQSSSKHGEQLRTAYAPDGIPRILFAGEATHERFYSTVHGALESGIQRAVQLMSIIEQRKETTIRAATSA